MIALTRSLGFDIARDPDEPDAVIASKRLVPA